MKHKIDNFLEKFEDMNDLLKIIGIYLLFTLFFILIEGSVQAISSFLNIFEGSKYSIIIVGIASILFIGLGLFTINSKKIRNQKNMGNLLIILISAYSVFGNKIIGNKFIFPIIALVSLVLVALFTKVNITKKGTSKLIFILICLFILYVGTEIITINYPHPEIKFTGHSSSNSNFDSNHEPEIHCQRYAAGTYEGVKFNCYLADAFRGAQNCSARQITFDGQQHKSNCTDIILEEGMNFLKLDFVTTNKYNTTETFTVNTNKMRIETYENYRQNRDKASAYFFGLLNFIFVLTPLIYKRWIDFIEN